MPDVCCAYGCTNRRTKENTHLSFYRMPSTKTKANVERRAKWIAAIKRDKWTETQINNARLCSSHFTTGNICCCFLTSRKLG